MLHAISGEHPLRLRYHGGRMCSHSVGRFWYCPHRHVLDRAWPGRGSHSWQRNRGNRDPGLPHTPHRCLECGMGSRSHRLSAPCTPQWHPELFLCHSGSPRSRVALSIIIPRTPQAEFPAAAEIPQQSTATQTSAAHPRMPLPLIPSSSSPSPPSFMWASKIPSEAGCPSYAVAPTQRCDPPLSPSASGSRSWPAAFSLPD